MAQEFPFLFLSVYRGSWDVSRKTGIRDTDAEYYKQEPCGKTPQAQGGKMEYKAFQYVLKIAELGNLTKAANELYVSQPSLSHYIARVEQEVGTPLFQRGVSPMRLTPAGEKYAETARMILALDKRMQQDISDIVNQKTGIIMLGMSHARASFLLPHVMPEMHRRYSRCSR